MSQRSHMSSVWPTHTVTHLSWFAVKVPHPRNPIVQGTLGQSVTPPTHPFLKMGLIASVQNLEAHVKHSKCPEPLENCRIWQLCAHICAWKQWAGAGWWQLLLDESSTLLQSPLCPLESHLPIHFTHYYTPGPL